VNIETRTDRNIEILQVSGSLDLQTAVIFRQQVNKLIMNGKTIIVFDFELLDFIDSSGLEVILSSHVTAKKANGFIALAGVNSSIERVFKITRMDRVFDVYQSVNEAVGALAR
jgi:anti-sigma B factor antagonist